MNSIDDAVAKLNSITLVIENMSGELEVIKAKLDAIPVGEVITEEQKAALTDSVNILSEKVNSVKAKEDELAGEGADKTVADKPE